MELIKFSEYYNVSQDDELNEGFKKWLAIFMILMQLGMVPASVMAGSTQDKMEYVQNLPKNDLDMARFVNHLNKRGAKVDEDEARKLFNTFKNNYNVNITFDDLWNKVRYDRNTGEYKFEEGVTSDKYSKWMWNVKPINYTNDYGEVIEDNVESQINKVLSDYEKKVDVEIAILTVPSLNGEDEFDYGIKIAEKWGVGKAETDNGVFILMSKQDRRIRIFTGYGIGGVLPDATCSRLIERVFKPYAKEGDYTGGFDALIKAMMSEIGEDEQIELKKERLEKESAERRRKVGNFFLILAEILGVIGVGYLIYRFIRIRNRKIAELRRQLNEQIERANRMGAALDRVDQSNITKESEQINRLKQQLAVAVVDNERLSKSNIKQIDATIDALVKEYNAAIRSFNSLEESIQIIERIERDTNKVIDPKYSVKIKELSTKIRDYVNRIKRTDIDLADSGEYERIVKQIRAAQGKLSKLKEVFDTIEVEDKSFGGFKESLLKKISRSLEAVSNIESMGYTYDNPTISDKEAERLEDMFNTVRGIYKEDVVKAYKYFQEYTQVKDRLIRRGNAIINYEDYMNDTKKLVDNYTMDKIEEYLKWINYRKYRKWKNDDNIASIRKEMGALEELLKNPVDFILVKNKIDEVEGMAKAEYDRVKGELEAEEEAERRRKREEEEEERRRRRRRQREEDDRRRRNSYSSYSSGSSSSGGSSFGGFGGGSFGGGGAGGGW